MPRSCAIYRYSATSTNEPNHLFHQLPKDEKLREACITRVRTEMHVPGPSFYVCSYHFGEDDFT